jgi:CubicO group peptidase (beta-lactamase class C family)
MKAKRIILLSTLVVVTISFVILAPLVSLFTAGMREPVIVPTPDYWSTNGWQSRSPEQMGIDSTRLAKGLLELQENGSNIDSLLIIHDGYVVLDAYFAPYDGSFPHDLASVTKSVTTTLVAIAADQGYIDLDRSIVSYFPDRTIANLDERKQRMTVRHIVGMVDGMEAVCDEDEQNLDAMRSTADWIQTALDRPMVAEPGEKFCYDSPGFHLLSAIIQNTTGMTLFDFAQTNLFQPLGIREANWNVDPQGFTHGWGDLHLFPRDVAKIGFLFLHRGQWNGKQVVPESWVLDAVRAHSRNLSDEYGYGYGWWISPADYYAAGREGQIVRVLNSKNTVIVTTGGGFDYAETESFLIPILIRLKNPLPANPEGQIALAEALNMIQQDPSPSSVTPSSDLIQSVSGTTYLCESNPVGVENLRVDFNDPMQATMTVKVKNLNRSWAIGTDGQFRVSPEGEILRGYWEDAQTFNYIVFDVGVVTYQLHFDDGMLEIRVPASDMMIPCYGQNS